MTCLQLPETSTSLHMSLLTSTRLHVHANTSLKIRSIMLNVLEKCPPLFGNCLGAHPDERMHLDLKPDAVPHCNPRGYQVPHVHRKVFKDELDQLVRIGVLEKCGRSEWMAGTFIVPKKLLPGETVPRVRWVSDFRGLNRCLRWKTHPIPRIGDILARRTGCEFLTKLDVSMRFYAFAF